MIYSLQKKFITICGIALSSLLAIIFLLIGIFSTVQLNSAIDQLTDKISSNGGRFPNKLDSGRLNKDEKRPFMGFITEETRFSTRYFSATFDSEGNLLSVNTESISSVNEAEAAEHGIKALKKSRERGWISSFRYKVVSTDSSTTVTFVDARMNISMTFSTVLTVCGVLFASFLAVFLLILFFSKRAVKPIAESYEKQKQFITDANHELKTPLTLILANLDIIEEETGNNEWINDIRCEGERMSALVNQLVTLTRMDEGAKNSQAESFNISELLNEVCGDFSALAEQKNKHLCVFVQDDVYYKGDAPALRRLFTILLDNAVKYCDEKGNISVTLIGGKYLTVCVENSYSAVDSTELDRLFDRFYRADKSRTYDGGFGIGLSIAKAIVQNHRGKIYAYKKDSSHIGFKVILK